MNLSEPPILAAMIGASATITAATVQLVTAWRKHSTDGDRRRTKGGARSLVMLILIVLSSAVAGYAYSQYRSQETRDETRTLQVEMQQQLHLLETTTAKLEEMRLNAVTGVDSQVQNAAERRRGAEGVAALVQLPACKGSQPASGSQRPACIEADALRVAVCAVVPANAQVSEVQLFARAEDSQQPWSESRVSAGQEAGNAKFIDAPLERPVEGGKQVCHNFLSWSSDKGRTARMQCTVQIVPSPT